MILAEYLKELEPTTNISLCYSNKWHLEPGSDNKIYDAFYVGTAREAPKEALNKAVIKSFTAFIWNTTTYILEEAQQ